MMQSCATPVHTLNSPVSPAQTPVHHLNSPISPPQTSVEMDNEDATESVQNKEEIQKESQTSAGASSSVSQGHERDSKQTLHRSPPPEEPTEVETHKPSSDSLSTDASFTMAATTEERTTTDAGKSSHHLTVFKWKVLIVFFRTLIAPYHMIWTWFMWL